MKKTAVITGGSKGIGLGITEAFFEAGYQVVVGARQKIDFSRFGDRIRFVSTNVCKESDHDKLVKEAISWTGRLDVYINNAGFSEWRPIENIDEEFFDLMISTNLKGALWGCKVASKHLKEGGSIINISSLAGKRGSSNNSLYVASKFGMNGLTQSLAKELGPKGIRVNGVCPVLVSTDGLLDALKQPDSPAQGNPEKFLSDFTKSNSALGRLPNAKEVASLCLFFASENASAITGQNVNVDCGVFPQ
ncbi:putative diacetyl reductase ((S)-acetoin forming) [Leptospira noguchii serovar Autumnalis str. ZUN142]|uniref:Putative diacetyl reductase ((S)-acetoin forming) n=2 Tax=Leptospira TaxID=171 RepID=M6UPV4_9LEPT|nr:SDR family oxidoreductase [Leptospira noguchii]EMO43059.1 putative diacetyl reductase ((S)-acetoin forming) [Leptospira noguchii serovar Autumnalis str. ZUN142]